MPKKRDIFAKLNVQSSERPDPVRSRERLQSYPVRSQQSRAARFALAAMGFARSAIQSSPRTLTHTAATVRQICRWGGGAVVRDRTNTYRENTAQVTHSQKAKLK